MSWELKFYLGREIKTQEDIIWVCEQLKKRVEKNGEMSLEDLGALYYIEGLHQKHIKDGHFGIIESRFEILDL